MPLLADLQPPPSDNREKSRQLARSARRRRCSAPHSACGRVRETSESARCVPRTRSAPPVTLSPVIYSSQGFRGGASGLGIRGGGLRWRLVIPAGRGSSPWDLLPELSTPTKPGLTQQGLNLLRG